MYSEIMFQEDLVYVKDKAGLSRDPRRNPEVLGNWWSLPTPSVPDNSVCGSVHAFSFESAGHETSDFPS